MYFRMRSAVVIEHVAPPCSHRSHVVPLRPAAFCSTVAGLMPRAAAYAATSFMSLSMSHNVGFKSYMVNGF